jgi:hypothetical protein
MAEMNLYIEFQFRVVPDTSHEGKFQIESRHLPRGKWTVVSDSLTAEDVNKQIDMTRERHNVEIADLRGLNFNA